MTIFEKHTSEISSKMLLIMGLIVNVREDKRDTRPRFLQVIQVIFLNTFMITDGIFQIIWIAQLIQDPQRDNNLFLQIMSTGISNYSCIIKVKIMYIFFIYHIH